MAGILKHPDSAIQHTTLCNWCNLYLNKSGLAVHDLTRDFANSLNLITLLETLSGKSVGKYNNTPRSEDDHRENIAQALAFMSQREQIQMKFPTVDEIMKGEAGPILGMVWALVMFYDIQHFHKRPKEDRQRAVPSRDLLLDWVNSQIYGVKDFEADWRDGRKLYNLVYAFEPGALARRPTTDDPTAIARMALEAAEQRLHVPTVISAEHLTSEHVDAPSIMTYLAGFRKAVTTTDDLERPFTQGGVPPEKYQPEIQPAQPQPYQPQQPQQQQQQARPPRVSQQQMPPSQQRPPSQRQQYSPQAVRPQAMQQQQYQIPPNVPMRTLPPRGPMRSQMYEQPRTHVSSYISSGFHQYEEPGFDRMRSRGMAMAPLQNSASQYQLSLAGWQGDYAAPTAGGPSARTFPVNLLERASAARLGRRGAMWLQVTLDDIALLDQLSGQLLYAWPLNHIKRYGKDINLFSLEIGNLNRNNGTFFFETPTCDDVFEVVKSSSTRGNHPTSRRARTINPSRC